MICLGCKIVMLQVGSKHESHGICESYQCVECLDQDSIIVPRLLGEWSNEMEWEGVPR